MSFSFPKPPPEPRPDPAIYQALGTDGVVQLIRAFYVEIGRSPIAHLFPGDFEALMASADNSALFWVNGATAIVAGTILAASAGRLGARLQGRTGRSGAGEVRAAAGSPKGFRDRRLLYFLFSVLPVFIIFFQHEAALPLFLVQDLHLPESAYGLVFTVNTILIVLVEVPLNLATARVPHRVMLPLGALLVGIGFGGMAVATGFWSIMATVVVWTFGEMVLLPTASTYMAEIAPAERRGEYMGLYQMTFSLAFALSASAGTAVLENFGGVTLWTGAFVAGCVSAALLSRLRADAGAHASLESPPASGSGRS